MSMPECWWIEVEFDNGEIWLEHPCDTRSDAESKLERMRQSVSEWKRKPQRLSVTQEAPARRVTERLLYGIRNLAELTARRNWIDRNSNLLEKMQPRACRVLVPTTDQSEKLGQPILQNRVGGLALMPTNARWPKIALQPWNDFTWHAATVHMQKLGLPPARQRFRGGLSHATYLATYDLRDQFDFGSHFPAGVSIFVSTYDEATDQYDADNANCRHTLGVAVPIFESDKLELRKPPDGVPALHGEQVQSCDAIDYPCYAVDPTAYDKVEKLERGTSSWINLDCRKIGGCPRFQQQDLLQVRRSARPDIDWHWIGCFTGLIELGDSGTLYLLAGRSRFLGRWRWHVEWQCG